MKPYFETGGVTLYCGDCREVIPALNVDGIELMIADPPYSRVRDDAWDRITPDDLIQLLDEVIMSAGKRMKTNSSAYFFCWPPFSDRLTGLLRRRTSFLGHLVWAKRLANGSMTGFAARQNVRMLRKYFTETERILFAEINSCPDRMSYPRRTFKAMKSRYTDLWYYPPVGSSSRLRIHNCQKPLGLLSDMMTISSEPGAVILDPFAGACASGIAAIGTGRTAILIEREESNCEKGAKWLETFVRSRT